MSTSSVLARPAVVNDDLPFPYEIDRATQILYAAVGPWTAESVTRWVQALMNDPAYLPGMRALINLRFAAGPLPQLDDLRGIAEALRPLTIVPSRTRWAMLVGSPEMFDRIRLLETLTSSGYVQIRAFDDDRQALSWLGLELPTTPWLVRG